MQEEKFSYTKKAGILGIWGNIFLLIIKAFIGFFTLNQAMIADSINSASDILASFMTFVGNKISSAPKDEDHDFGHGKAEYLFSLFISITMILASIKLAIDSLKGLVTNKEFNFSWFLIVVCAITFITKLSLYIYTKSLYKKYESILLKSNYKDHRNDCIVVSFTALSAICGYFGIFWVDGLIGSRNFNMDFTNWT